MKIQTGPSYPYLVGRLPVSPALLQAKTLPPPPPAVLGATPISPILRAQKLHVFSPTLASEAPSNEKLLEGLRALSGLITPQLGQKVSVAVNTLWFAADTVSTVRTFRDAESSTADKVIETGELGSSALALLSGILGGAPRLDNASTAIHFAAVVGDKLHTGQITFSQSELAEFSTLPQAEDVANYLKLSEVIQPGTA